MVKTAIQVENAAFAAHAKKLSTTAIRRILNGSTYGRKLKCHAYAELLRRQQGRTAQNRLLPW